MKWEEANTWKRTDGIRKIVLKIKIKRQLHSIDYEFIYREICTRLPPPPPFTPPLILNLLNDKRLLVVEIPRRHVEIAANQHRHLSQIQGSSNRNMGAIMLHGPTGRWCSKLRRHMQLLQEGLVADLLESAHSAETLHRNRPRLSFNFLSRDGVLGHGSRAPSQLKQDTVILDRIILGSVHYHKHGTLMNSGYGTDNNSSCSCCWTQSAADDSR